jgi:hypothetical protein
LGQPLQGHVRDLRPRSREVALRSTLATLGLAVAKPAPKARRFLRSADGRSHVAGAGRTGVFVVRWIARVEHMFDRIARGADRKRAFLEPCRDQKVCPPEQMSHCPQRQSRTGVGCRGGSYGAASGSPRGRPSPVGLLLCAHLGPMPAFCRQDLGTAGVDIAPSQVGMEPGGQRDVVWILGVVSTTSRNGRTGTRCGSSNCVGGT